MINPTVSTANINFDFDGMCDVAVQVVPDGLDASLTSSGTVITVTVSEKADSDWDIYSLQLLSTRMGRSWPMVSTTVFYGLEIQGFQVCNVRYVIVCLFLSTVKAILNYFQVNRPFH